MYSLHRFVRSSSSSSINNNINKVALYKHTTSTVLCQKQQLRTYKLSTQLYQRKQQHQQQHDNIIIQPTQQQPTKLSGITYQQHRIQSYQPPNLQYSNRNLQRSNIILMGPPGSGKSSVAKILAKKLNMSTIDIDDDVLEPNWNMTVAQALSQYGDELFIQKEAAETVKQLSSIQNTIVSLSGSNPLDSNTMSVLSKNGTIVYLDIDKQCILKRCEHMKVDRIVGQRNNSLSDILDYRGSIYESCYDIRVLVPYQHTANEHNVDDISTVEAIANTAYNHLIQNNKQRYISTRGFNGTDSNNDGITYELLDAIRVGLAPDRGLFVAEQFQPFHVAQLHRLVNLSYPEVALRVLERFPLGSLHPTHLRHLLYDAYSTFNNADILPVKHLHNHYYIAETFHGPTASFKDLSLQLLPSLTREAVTTQTQLRRKQQQNNSNNLISNTGQPRVGLLVATSGDTGTAALSGFSRHSDSGPVIVLYPIHGVSVVQKLQMLTSTGNVLVLGVEGDFDFCQTTVKNILNDNKIQSELTSLCPGLLLSSANSMNFGRFVPQVVYALYSYLQLVQQNVIKIGDYIDLTIPTGNFGNILAAVYARHIGIPIRNLICASNDNNVLADLIQTGEYDIRKRAFHQTVSPSIDILVSSNLERFIHMLSNGDSELVSKLFNQLHQELHFKLPDNVFSKLQEYIKGGWCNQQQCLQTIHDIYKQTQELIDPHTAVAVKVAQQYSPIDNTNSSDKVPMVIMSTAHWGKFPPAMLTALTGNNVDNGAKLEPEQLSKVANDMFQRLEKLPRNANSTQHPQLAALTHLPIQHYNTVPADQQAIVDRIKQFVQQYAQTIQTRQQL